MRSSREEQSRPLLTTTDLIDQFKPRSLGRRHISAVRVDVALPGERPHVVDIVRIAAILETLDVMAFQFSAPSTLGAAPGIALERPPPRPGPPALIKSSVMTRSGMAPAHLCFSFSIGRIDLREDSVIGSWWW